MNGIRAGLKSMNYLDKKTLPHTGVYFVQRGSRFEGPLANKSVQVANRNSIKLYRYPTLPYF